ncbi:hypothetical protein BT93_F1296 [Corymbia citriodora subsp. variegata]|nr:hypothetical protein BT93_F1296 [Corymbia citriodora subsp. variegata]
MALTATTLAVANLFPGMASKWSMAFLFFLGMIVVAVVKRRNRESSSTSLSALSGINHEESPSTSLSTSSGINHEVFLSFRGKDTRKDFTDLLYEQLKKERIEVFKDDKNLRGGEEINQGLKDAIKRSRISIAIFSKDYASSPSCLMELVQMWKCNKSNGQIIIPIFLDVSPDDVEHQTGDFAKSFEDHKKVFNSNTIETWKKVLQQTVEFVGYEQEKINGGKVTALLEIVVTRVRQLLKKDDQSIIDKLVGIDLHVQKMMTKLGVVYSNGKATKVCGDGRVVGICGMPGVGKTTLAKVVFNKMHELFDGCSFLDGVNSERVEISQEKLIADLKKERRESLRSSDEGFKIISSRFSSMKVLIVLDDVHEDEQIKILAGKLSWFGEGSRIIVTTSNSNVLGVFNNKAVEKYKVKPMKNIRALELFHEHAFQGDAPLDDPDYDYLSRDIVEALGGHPMAIVLRANNLKNKNIETWRSIRDSVRADPPEKAVGDAFMAIYNSLEDQTQETFLDIACFFIGNDKRIPSYMWKACGFHPPKEIEELCDMHLLEIGKNNELRMHSLLRDFGRKLVKEKGPVNRCRFWDHKDALPNPKNVEGTLNVRGIGFTIETGFTNSFNCETFSEMSNLWYLRLDRAKIQGNTKDLPQNLRWLDWRECPLIPKLCDMHLKELVILDLSKSEVTKISEFWEQITEKVEKLKVLNLQGCKKLHALLNFPASTDLEILVLEDCPLLFRIGAFIRYLKNLSSLNLRNCGRVKYLPQELGGIKSLRELLIDGTGICSICFPEGSLENLEILSARDCKNLAFISAIGHLTKLQSLALDGANIKWHPQTFIFPQNLRSLSLRNCRMVKELPISIGKLGLLEVMDLSETEIEKLPESVKHLSNLKTLKMEQSSLKNFPEDIVKLEKLEEIDFSRCKSLEGRVCCDISGLSSLRILRLSSSDVAGLPQRICRLSRLQTLDVRKCRQLKALPELPSSLVTLRWGSKSMDVPKLTNLTNLKELCLNHGRQPLPEAASSNQTPNIGWIVGLTSLETLELSLPNVCNLPGDFRALTQLRELTLSYMEELDLTQLPSSSSLWTLRLKCCMIQEPKFSGLKSLSELELDNCDLAMIDGLGDLRNLEVLKIFQNRRITDLNELKGLPRFRKQGDLLAAGAADRTGDDPVLLDVSRDTKEVEGVSALRCENGGPLRCFHALQADSASRLATTVTSVTKNVTKREKKGRKARSKFGGSALITGPQE